MATTQSYLYAVQDDQGREIVSAHVEVEKVSDVRAVYDAGNTVSLVFEDIVIEQGHHDGSGPLTLHRWPSDDKLAQPVSHPVK